MRLKARSSPNSESLAGYPVAVIAPLVAFGLWTVVKPLFAGAPTSVLFTVAVALAAWRGGFWPGIMATFLSAALFDCFMMQPSGMFKLGNAGEQIRMAAFITSGCLMSLIGGEARRATLRERTRAQHLEETEERLRLSLHGARAGVWQRDFSTGALTWSDELKELFGVLPSQTPERDVFVDLIHPEDRIRARQEFACAVKRGGPFVLEFRVIRQADQKVVWLSSVGVIELDGSGKPRVARGINQDITARKEAELQLTNAKAQLEQVNANLEKIVAERTASLRAANEQLEMFCSTIAHDLRAPLRRQYAFADVLLEDYGDKLDEEARNHLYRIHNSATRLEKLVNDLLTYSRVTRENLPSERVNASTLVDDLEAQFADQVTKENASLQIDRTTLKDIVAHETTLFLLISNLISNALKFKRADVPAFIRLWMEPVGDSVRLFVQDNGIGIPNEFERKIFGEFERFHSDNMYPGTGLGLAIVKKGVERMGGKVGVKSAEGKGSTFWIELPMA